MSLLQLPIFRLFLASFVVAVLAYVGWSFFLRDDAPLSRSLPAPESPAVIVPKEVVGTPIVAPALTRDAQELRRVASEHALLLTSVPPTPEPTPTLTVAQLQGQVGFVIAANPEGGPAPTIDLLSWFDPEAGLEFCHPEGGDWTSPELRKTHPFRELFYYEGYPPGVSAFHDGSIYLSLARRLIPEGGDVLPVFRNPAASVYSVVAQRVGWEIRDPESPAINVWSTFELVEGSVTSVFAIGGVMLLEVGSVSSDGDPVPYLVAGEFLGPVIVQRLGTRLPGSE